MKKLTTILIILLVALSCIFAESTGFDFNAESFEPTKSSSMNSIAYKLYKDPASLHGVKWMFEVPHISLTAYNDSKVLSDPEAAKYLSEILTMNFNKTNVLGFLSKFVDNIGSSNGMVATADLQTGFEYKNFAFSLDAQVKVHSYSEGLSIINACFYPEINGAAAAGYAFRVFEKGNRSVDVGLSARLSYRAYTAPVDASTISSGLEGMTYYTGFAIPLNASVSFNFFNEILKVKAGLTNVNGTYHMKSYNDLEKAVKLGDGNLDSMDFKIPASLNIGFVVDPHLKGLNPTLTFEFKQINTFLSADINNDSVEVLKYITLKGNLQVFKIANVYAAYEGGYLTCGATVGYRGNQLEVHYGWEELGQLLGQKPTDYLTFAIKCGWDKN